ncbi:MAG TPA: YbaB/EbfC family nucleoid-associated protein [Candidatus Eremiobacteraceae bacterium]|nr:YbaB/EbfC family nucleoid-associated protein [Candidatus Eremiobacteraceae bacterium]
MNPQQMMAQARKLQAQLARVQEELGQESVTGTAGSGSVTITLDGHGAVQSVKLSKDAVDPDDVEMLEDLLVLALKDAQAKAQALSQARLGPLAGGIGMPGF